MIKYKQVLMFWNTEEWWPCWIGLVAFAVCAVCSFFNLLAPAFIVWINNPLDSLNRTIYIGVPSVFLFMLVSMSIFLFATGEGGQAKFFPLGFLLIFSICIISKWVAAEYYLHEYGIGDSIFAIGIGMVLCNVMDLFSKSDSNPKWIKIAQQTEAYIAVSLVLLLIDINELLQLAFRAVVVACVDTPILVIVMPMIGVLVFKQDRTLVIITTCVAVICGSSAGMASAAALGLDKSKAQLPIAISSLMTVPAIIFLPIFANLMHLSDDVAGAWFGGCVDSTGAVMATAALYGTSETTAPESQRAALGSFAFTVGEWFSTCSFVSIGLNLLLRPLFGQAKQTIFILAFYLLVQSTDIILTLIMAWVAFSPNVFLFCKVFIFN